MLSQILVLSPGVVDISGWLKLIYFASREPVVPIALLAIPAIIAGTWPRWSPLLTFIAISWGVSALIALQAGGNINYFFEPLFALVPVGVVGLVRLLSWSKRNSAVALFNAVLFLFCLFPAEDLYAAVREGMFPRYQSEIQNDLLLRRVQSILQGKHILSTVPRIALMDPSPTLMEPYLFSYLQRLGKFDPKPILDRVRNQEFDLVITLAYAASWRSVPVVSADLRSAIATRYSPECVFLEALRPPLRSSSWPSRLLLHFPRGRDNSVLIQEFAAIGCVPDAAWKQSSHDW
jgi:hypothetical protein